MDYNFLTIERFMELEKSGALLESGTYEGELPGDERGGKRAGGDSGSLRICMAKGKSFAAALMALVVVMT